MMIRKMLIFRTIKFLSLVLLCFSTFSVKGQGCCSGGTPLSGNLDLAANEPGTFSLRMIYDYNHLGSVIIGNKESADRSRARLTKTGLLRVDYGLNRRWAFSSLFTFVRQSEKVSFFNIQNTTFGQGIGDLVLMAQYNFLNDPDLQFSIGGGVKLPTGSISEINEVNDLLLPPDLQPGTGATDFITVSQFSKKNIFFENLNFRTGATFRYTTAADRFQQQQQYKFGNIFQSFVGFNRHFYINKSLLTPQMTLRYRYSNADQTDGFRTINTGGHWIYFIGGAAYLLNKNFEINFNTELPVFWQLEGVQLTTSYKLIIGLTYNFSKKQNTTIKDRFKI